MQNITPIKSAVIAHINQRSKKKVEIYNSEADRLDTNYTINFFPSEKLARVLQNTVDYFREKYPNNQYIPQEKLHSTIVGLIPLETSSEMIIKFIKANIPRDLRFRYEGMDVSRKAASFLAFPRNLGLEKVRAVFAEEVSEAVLKYYNYYKDIGWVNFIRYLEQPSEEFYCDILSRIDTHFGTTTGKIQLLKNSSRTLKESEVVFEL